MIQRENVEEIDIFDEIFAEIGYRFPTGTEFSNEAKGLKIEKSAGKLTVGYSLPNELARAALILKARDADCDFSYAERPLFDDVCLMVDCSRNAVRNVGTVKKLIRNIAMCGYNALMLYMEDTYEIEGEPFFGYMRGRYTKEEIGEIDKYARLFGIELIPCIQTLAHLQALRRYIRFCDLFDADYTLMVGDERVYELIEKMFSSVAQSFSSRRIHIGMDEPYMLGKGRYLWEHGYHTTREIYFKHLLRVEEIAEKYGFKPILWSDMFIQCAYEGDRSDLSDPHLPPEVIRCMNKMELVHWNYDSTDSKNYEDKLNKHEKLGVPYWFASTAWENRGILPHNTYSTKVTDAALEAVKKCNVRHIMETMWGDDANEGSLFGSLPALVWFSLRARGREESEIKREFFALTGYDFDVFNKIEYPQTFCGKYTDDHENPAKYGLFNDIFSGWLDPEIDEADEKYFVCAAKEIHAVPSGEYGYLFHTAEALANVLAVKYGLGIRLRKAYRNGDCRKMEEIVLQLQNLERRVTKLINCYRAQWYKENKPGGFEIQEIKLGGLRERIRSCRLRLKDYIAGKISAIEELDTELLPNMWVNGGEKRRVDVREYRKIISINRFDDNIIF